jgi:hypothetical protein
MLLNPPFVPIRLPGVQSLVSGRWLASDAVWLAAILTLSTVLILLWTCTVPFQQAPDEAAHFQVVRFIRDFGRLPRFAPEELWLLRTQVGAVESYATFPPLAYILAALLTVATHDHSFWASRAVSIVSYTARSGSPLPLPVASSLRRASWRSPAVSSLPCSRSSRSRART